MILGKVNHDASFPAGESRLLVSVNVVNGAGAVARVTTPSERFEELHYLGVFAEKEFLGALECCDRIKSVADRAANISRISTRGFYPVQIVFMIGVTYVDAAFQAQIMEVVAYLVDGINELLFKPRSIFCRVVKRPLRATIKLALRILGVYGVFFRDEAVNDFFSS